ncbi:MAG TPA: hypothetical protein VH062_29460 [Polyangiaceae bacterium]|jgi:hypothetical protein|nr:hypothetical protein [Polyangiaceae bacterium]
MQERSGESPRRGRKPVNWAVVLVVLVVTCMAMLRAIYWAVQSGKL